MKAHLFNKLSNGAETPDGKVDPLLKQSEAQVSLITKVAQWVQKQKPSVSEIETQVYEYMFQKDDSELDHKLDDKLSGSSEE